MNPEMATPAGIYADYGNNNISQKSQIKLKLH